jgi:Ca2+-transporting ATPase
VTDSFPALALGVEKGDPDIMSQNPRNPNEPILDKHMVIGIVFQSIAIAIAALSAYWWGIYRYGLDNILEARTIAFTTLITAELLRAYSTRSTHYTMFEIGVFSNKTLVYGTTFSFILMLVVIYIPFLNPIFHTFPLGFTDWEIILAFAFLPLLIGEIVKLIVHKKH